MNSWSHFTARSTPRWGVIAVSVALVVLALLVAPQLYLLSVTSLPVFVAGGIVGYFARRKFTDATLFVSAYGFAEIYGEPLAGPYVLAILSFGLLGFSGRPRFAIFSGSALFGLLLASVELKRRFAGSALTWQDLRYFFLQFSDNVGVFATQPTLLMYAAIAAIFIIAIAAAMWRSDGPFRPGVKLDVRVYYLIRTLSLLIVFWCTSELMALAQRKSFASPWQFAEIMSSTPVSTFFSTVHIDPVAQLNRVDTQLFANKVRALIERPRQAYTPADIVIFLQESQFNPKYIQGCPPGFCESTVFQPSGTTTDSGELRVHVFGGGTWLTEFSFITGLPHTLYGPAGDFAPFNVAPGVRRSFVRSLKTAGYYTVALYPVRGGMMNARAAYQAYGFDEFLDSDDLGLSGAFETPDSKIHEAAIRTLKDARQRGKPVLLVAVTIFNHGEHGHLMGRIPSSVSDEGKTVAGTAVEKSNVTDYVWRTREFEKTYEKTKATLFASSRPTVLGWFGDHQPPFGNAPQLRQRISASLSNPEIPSRYLTWYDVATSPKRTSQEPHRKPLDIVFLSGVLAQRANVALDDWLAANVLAREGCNGLIVECADPAVRDAYFSYLLGNLEAVR